MTCASSLQTMTTASNVSAKRTTLGSGPGMQAALVADLDFDRHPTHVSLSIPDLLSSYRRPGSGWLPGCTSARRPARS